MTTAHVLVKNEENFIWYSVVSVINYIDTIMIWDTGSTDSTKQIIEDLRKEYPNKIDYKEVGNVDEKEYSRVRQQMLDETKSDWIFILDGDEIWWNDSIFKVIEFIRKHNDEYESIVVPTVNLVGDIFHYQAKEAGKYNLLGKTGHFALRFMNRKKIIDLHIFESYGKEGFADADNTPIQNRSRKLIKFMDLSYIHTTHLRRSSQDDKVMQRNKKLKYEIGLEFPKDFYYPEVFFRERPEFVPNVWKNMGLKYKFRAFFETPVKKIRRRILSSQI